MTKIENHVFISRRNQLFELMPDTAIAVVVSADFMIRNGDSEYPFRQNSDFYYLTGMNEPETILILQKNKNDKQSILFCRERNPEREIWDGARIGQAGAVEKLGMDTSFSIDTVEDKVPNLLLGCKQVFCSFDVKSTANEQVIGWIQLLKEKVRKGVERPTSIHDLDALLHEMRLIKSSDEISILREAAKITAGAFFEAMTIAKSEMYEYELEAVLRSHCVKNGAHHMAYNPIVAGGNNACTLHYTDNNNKIKEGDLVLIDSGCELDCYASDVTRTFPINGQFTKSQQAIYNLVLKAQEAVIDLIVPGIAWNILNEKTIEIITSGLIELGLISGDLEQCIKEGVYKPFFMHGTGHWLGMDVHDVGDYKYHGRWRALEVGMVFTVEPGIYIGQNNKQVDTKWRGIGVRIEDDVVVTASGCEILTASIPKTVEAIEALMAS